MKEQIPGIGLAAIFNNLYYDDVVWKKNKTRMWANAQPDGRPAEHRWRPLFNAPKFG